MVIDPVWLGFAGSIVAVIFGYGQLVSRVTDHNRRVQKLEAESLSHTGSRHEVVDRLARIETMLAQIFESRARHSPPLDPYNIYTKTPPY